MKFNHYKLATGIKFLARFICYSYVLIQTISSSYDVAWSSAKIQLTTVKADRNQEIHHPLYTMCPIYNESANLFHPGATLGSVMVQNSMNLNPAMVLDYQNSLTVKTRMFTTWVKTHSANKKQQTFLVQCQTFQVQDPVVPGKQEGKLTLAFSGRSPATQRVSPHVKEFHLYIHQKSSYMHTFMLVNNGRPHVILPGYDMEAQMQKPQLFHVTIKQKWIEHLDNCLEEEEESDAFCVENYLKEKLAPDCLLPWRSSNVSICPPCNWGQMDMSEVSCHSESWATGNLVPDSSCHAYVANGHDCLLNTGLAEHCMLCDDPCVPYPREDLCMDRQSLETMISHLPFPWQLNDLLEQSTCKLPCSYYSYDVTEAEPTSTEEKLTPSWKVQGILTLQLATDDIVTVQEVPAHTLQALLSDFSGTTGMLLGFSFYSLFFSKKTAGRFKNRAREAVNAALLLTAFVWSWNSFDKIRENQISHELKVSQVTAASLRPLLITLCPVYNDSLFFPAKGSPSMEMDFRKYSSYHNRNFLAKDYPYMGTWSKKWKFEQSTIVPFLTLGEKCFTYHPGDSESKKIVIELNRKGLEYLKGYLHDYDSIEYAFMHTSSEPKLWIPFYNPVYNHGRQLRQANIFHYTVRETMVSDFINKDCIEEDETEPKKVCFSAFLEKQLGCHVPLDHANSSICPKCQMPFQYKGMNYNECIQDDATQPWCPTAVYMDRNQVENAWDYCYNECVEQDIQIVEDYCESKEDLHRYIDIYHDRSRASPESIAKELKTIDCPFKCQYRNYQANLDYKLHSPAVGENRIRLEFELSEQSSVQNIDMGLDYKPDMFISDIGNAFGLLLGMSLIELIQLIWKSAVRLKDERRPTMSACYFLSKYLAILTFTLYIIISGLSSKFQTDSVGEAAANPQTDIDDNSVDSIIIKLKVGDKDSIKSRVLEEESLNGCPYADDQGDYYCDDRANNPLCNYDGNDCCSPRKFAMPNAHNFCQNCSCLHQEQMDNRTLKLGTCQFCVFPYKDPFFAQDMKHDCSYNLYFGQFYCPVVVNKITNEPLNHMLVMACPDKESWEEQPTCFIPETSPETSDSNDTKPTTPKSEVPISTGQLWREDSYCGIGHYLPNSFEAQCNPDNHGACCCSKYNKCFGKGDGFCDAFFDFCHRSPGGERKDWSAIGESLVYFYNKPQDVFSAQQFCHSFSARIYEPRSLSALDLVAQEARNFYIARFWLGITDAFSEGRFVFMSDKVNVSDFNWNFGEPSNLWGSLEEDYAEMDIYIDGHWKWNDIPGSATHPSVVCEKTAAPECPDNGKRYIGPDLGHRENVSSFLDCQQHCLVTSECTIVSYDFLAGKCHLMSGWHDAEDHPGFISGPSRCLNPVCPEEGVLYTGEDINVLTDIIDFWTCQDYCQETKDCHFVSFLVKESTCLLKSSVGKNRVESNSNAISGPRSCFNLPCQEQAVNHHGSDITSRHWIVSFEECQKLCREEEPECRYVAYDGHTCWMKFSRDNVIVGHPGLTSGPVVCPASNCIDKDVEYFGNDIAKMDNFNGTIEDCRQACFDNNDCKYFSFSSDLRECWLKSSKDYIKQNLHFQSGPDRCQELPCPEREVEYMGNNIDIVKNVTDFWECLTECRHNGSDCKFVSYHTRSLECHLKSDREYVKITRGVISGFKNCSVSNEEDNVHLFGRLCQANDVPSACRNGCWTSGPEECEERCVSDEFCHGWTLNLVNNHCWLKITSACFEHTDNSDWIYGTVNKPANLEDAERFKDQVLLVVNGEPYHEAREAELFEFIMPTLVADNTCNVSNDLLFPFENHASVLEVLTSKDSRGAETLIPMTCGGMDAEGFQLDSCHQFVNGSWTEMSGRLIIARSRASSIALTEDAIFIIGGQSVIGEALLHTEFVAVDSKSNEIIATRYPDIPEPLSGGCFVKINCTEAIAIGGSSNVTTYIFSIPTRTWSVGPGIYQPRLIKDCALIHDIEETLSYVVVSGGNNPNNSGELLRSTELWIVGSDHWHFGPDLPSDFTFDHSSSMISSPDKQGALLISQKSILELKCKSNICIWKQHYGQLVVLRRHGNVMFLPGHMLGCADDTDDQRLVVINGLPGNESMSAEIFGKGKQTPIPMDRELAKQFNNPEYIMGATGATLGGGGNITVKLLICGGRQPDSPMVTDRCYYFRNKKWTVNVGQSLSTFREHAASLKLNNSTLLIVGGATRGAHRLTSSELVSLDNHDKDTEEGPVLPREHQVGCIVKLNDTMALMIGGEYDNTTYYLELNQSTWIPGPQLNEARLIMYCVILNDMMLHELSWVVVAGGWYDFRLIQSTELLQFKQGSSAWQFGPDLPLNPATGNPIYDGSFMVSTPDSKGALLMGGHAWPDGFQRQMLMLRCWNRDCSWTKLDVELKVARWYATALLIPRSLVHDEQMEMSSTTKTSTETLGKPHYQTTENAAKCYLMIGTRLLLFGVLASYKLYT